MSVRHAILALVAEQPRHGYDLLRAFGSLLGEVGWDVKPAQVYTTLARLEEAGCVEHAATEQHGGPAKRIYAVTETGLSELRRWFGEGVTGAHARDEFFVKLMAAVNGGHADPWRVIRTQRTSLYRDLHAITAHRNTLDPHTQLATMLLLDKAVMHIEADLRWLDMIEARLDDVRSQPPPEPTPRRRGRPPKRAAADGVKASAGKETVRPAQGARSGEEGSWR